MTKRRNRNGRRKEKRTPVPGFVKGPIRLGRRIPLHLREGSSSLERPPDTRKVE